MQHCLKCSIPKEEGKRCIPCKKAYERGWYRNNASRRKKMVAVNVKTMRQRYKEELDTLKSGPCTDCGNRFPPCAMDFDHVTGEKSDDVSRLIHLGYSVARIKTEISKCELVCAVCHRIRTQKRFLGP